MHPHPSRRPKAAWFVGVIFIVLLLLLAQVISPSIAQGTTTRIMPLGDSITQGSGEHNSYRRALWQLLQAGSYNVDFVGSLNTNYFAPPPDPDFDLDHEGHWGWRTDEVLAQLPTWAAAADPDIVLVHLGTNDLFQGQTVASTITELGQVIDVLRTANASVTILLAQVIPSTMADVSSLNAEIANLAAAKTSAQSPVLLVDQYTGFNTATDTYDGTHPNDDGETKIANRWYAALQPLLNTPTNTPMPPTNTPIPPTNTPVPPTNTPIPPTNTPVPPTSTPVQVLTFYRAVNLGGSAITIDGNAWEGSVPRYYTTDGFGACNPWQTLSPSTDTNRATMLRCNVEHSAHNITMNSVPSGRYAVYLYAWLDWTNPIPQPFSVQVEGQTVQSGIMLSNVGDWRKLGPWVINVTDGTLNLTTSGGLAGLSGLEVWHSTDSTTTSSYPLPNDLPTSTPYPTTTPMPTTALTATAIPPTSTSVVTSGPTFYRALNLGGDAVMVDGNAWEGSSAPNYTTNGNAACNPWTPLTPETDAARTTMIQCHVQHWAHLLTLSGVPGGTYDIYAYAWLDWDDPNAAPFSVQVEGQTMQTGILIGNAGQWQKLGPWRVTVSDGTIDLATDGALVNLSGVEVWAISAGLNGDGGSD